MVIFSTYVRRSLPFVSRFTSILMLEGNQLRLLNIIGRWFSSGTPASSTTKTGRHDIAEILLKVALNTKSKIQIQIFTS